MESDQQREQESGTRRTRKPPDETPEERDTSTSALGPHVGEDGQVQAPPEASGTPTEAVSPQEWDDVPEALR